MVFRSRADNGPTLDAGLVDVRFTREPTSFAKEPIALQLLFISEEVAKIWRLKHPYSWTIDDVTSWGTYVAETNSLSQSLHRALIINLRRFSGKQLMHMTYDDVRRRFSDVGDILYSAMQQLFSGYTEYQGGSKGCFRNVPESDQEKQMSEQERHRLRWTRLHPDHWSSVEVASWINYVADEHKFSAEERCNVSEAFDSVTGTQLLSMTKDEFLQADPSKGGLLFDIFKGVFPSDLSLNSQGLEQKDFLLAAINEDSGSGSSRDTSPSVRRKSSSI